MWRAAHHIKERREIGRADRSGFSNVVYPSELLIPGPDKQVETKLL